MKIDITELLIFFDELMPATDEEQGFYWFRTSRNDGLSITLATSIYESKVAISVYTSTETTITSLHFTSCLEIKILDKNNKSLEILHGNENGRCFLSLLGTPILEYKD